MNTVTVVTSDMDAAAKREARNARRRELRAEKRAAAAAAAAAAAKKVPGKRAEKREAALALIKKMKAVDATEKAIVETLQTEQGLTYHNARYYVRIVYPAKAS